MKLIIPIVTTLFIFLFTNQLTAQEVHKIIKIGQEQQPENGVYNFAVVDSVPVIGDCLQVANGLEEMNCMNQYLMDYVNANYIFPADEKGKYKSYRIFVSFVIEEDGSLSDVKVERGVSALLDAEALRVVRSINFKKAAIKDGKPVKMAYMIPINAKK
jgi:TonB family protein